MDTRPQGILDHSYAADVAQAGVAYRVYAQELGADLYGVAAAEDFCLFPTKPQPDRFVQGARSVIVVGMAFTRSTMMSVLRPELSGLARRAADSVTNKAQPQGAERFFMDEENALLSREVSLIAYRMVRRLEREGHSAFEPTPSKQDARFRTAPFYHTVAMHLAGMGTMGYNCCIITPEFGPRVWVTSVITDRELPAGRPLAEELCDKEHCMRCVKACPSGALDGRGWKNPFLCASYGCCGTCVAICPKGEQTTA